MGKHMEKAEVERIVSGYLNLLKKGYKNKEIAEKLNVDYNRMHYQLSKRGLWSNDQNRPPKKEGGKSMSKELALVKDCFTHSNAFKRSRTLAEQARKSGNQVEASKHELNMYQRFDALELALRGLQRRLHEHDSQSD